MPELVDDRLKNWITTIVPEGMEVSLAAPDMHKTGTGISAYLLDVVPTPVPSTYKRAPLQLNLKYMITSWSDKPEDAHQALVELMFSALENSEFQVDRDPMPMTAWTAFGAAPRPHFLVSVPLRQERPEPQTKLVRQPLKLNASPVIGFHGRVAGPEDIPVSNCRVEMPALNLSTNTDRHGRFYFAAVPAEGTKQLLLQARGRELSISSEQNYPDSAAPMIISFSSLED
jgi:hypothetical protein